MKPSISSARTFASPTTAVADRSRAGEWADAALRWSALLAAALVFVAMAEPLWAPKAPARAMPSNPPPVAAAEGAQAAVAVEGAARR